MAQPPGKLTWASPKCAKVGPNTKMDARMVLTKSYGAHNSFKVPQLMSNTLTPSVDTVAPMPSSNLCVVFTSRSIGTLVKRRVSLVSKAAHIKGKAAFLAPEMVISPLSGPLA